MGPGQQCAWSENNRISVLDTEFILQKYIQHDIVVGPVDVKFIKDQLLGKSDNLHLLNANGDTFEISFQLEMCVLHSSLQLIVSVSF